MTVNKLSTTDAFVVIDLDDAPVSTGIVRWAKRILVDGATNLARVTTYTYASFGIERGGASGGVSAPPDGRDAAIAAFVAELASQVDAGTLVLEPGKGVNRSDLAAWPIYAEGQADPAADHDQRLATGVVAAADAALGGLSGATVAVEDVGPATAAIAAAFTAAGAEVAHQGADVLGAEVDVLAIGSKPGVLAHELVPSLACRVIVPTGPIPVTARALAHARRRDIVVLPDFVSIAGPTLPVDVDVAAAVGAVIGEVRDDPDGPLLGACHRAEEFLRSWHPTLPFGRPLA